MKSRARNVLQNFTVLRIFCPERDELGYVIHWSEVYHFDTTHISFNTPRKPIILQFYREMGSKLLRVWNRINLDSTRKTFNDLRKCAEDTQLFEMTLKNIVENSWNWFASFKTAINRVLRESLHLLPYRLQNVQELEQRHYETHIEFSRWCVENSQLDALFPNRATFYD